MPSSSRHLTSTSKRESENSSSRRDAKVPPIRHSTIEKRSDNKNSTSSSRRDRDAKMPPPLTSSSSTRHSTSASKRQSEHSSSSKREPKSKIELRDSVQSTKRQSERNTSSSVSSKREVKSVQSSSTHLVDKKHTENSSSSKRERENNRDYGQSRHRDARKEEKNEHKQQKQPQPNSSSSKPRILPPTDSVSEPSTNILERQLAAPKLIIVNELSADSIKREEHPLKGTMSMRRALRGGRFGGYYPRQPGTTTGRGGTFGTNRGGPFRDGIGTRGGYTQNRWKPYDQGRTVEYGIIVKSGSGGGSKYPSTVRRVIVEDEDSCDAVDDPNKPTMTLIKPDFVPRGRNYYLHDQRDAMPDSNRLYDPRLDRGGPAGRRGGRFMRRRGSGFIGARDSGGGAGGAPLGWRNFDTQESGTFSNTFSRGGRGGFRGRGAFIGGGFHSQADEDLVWKHDKFMEVAQDEVNPNLELVDEVDAEMLQGVSGGMQQDEGWDEEGQNGEQNYYYGYEVRDRYQREGDDELMEEAEELVVYD